MTLTSSLLIIAGACEKATSTAGGAVASIEVDPPSVTLTPGTATPITARVLDESGAPLNVQVFWAAEDERVARVSERGIVSAVTTGRTQVAASRAGLSAVVAVTVSALPPVLLRVTPNAAQMNAGDTTAFVAELFDARGSKIFGRRITWSSDNTAVANVDSGGVVIGSGPGTALVTATAGSLTGTAVVTVQQPPVSRVTVAPSTANIRVGRTLQLEARVIDVLGKVLNGLSVSWASSNPLRATVLPTGLVTGLAKGNVVITATSGGKSASSSITVR